MGFREVSQKEIERSIPAQKEMNRFEQLIRKPTSPPSQPSFLTQVIPKKPIPPSPIPEPAPQPIPVVEPVAIQVIKPEPLPQPKKIVHDKPLDPEFLFHKRTFEPKPIIVVKPPVEPVVLSAVLAQPAPLIPAPQPTVSEYPDMAEIYRRQPEPIPDILDTPKRRISLPKLHLPKFSLPRPHLPSIKNMNLNWLIWVFFIVRIALAGVLIWLGLATSGSVYGPAAGKFMGDWATLFYRWGFGYLLAMVGIIIAYDTIRFRIR